MDALTASWAGASKEMEQVECKVMQTMPVYTLHRLYRPDDADSPRDSSAVVQTWLLLTTPGHVLLDSAHTKSCTFQGLQAASSLAWGREACMLAVMLATDIRFSMHSAWVAAMG